MLAFIWNHQDSFSCSNKNYTFSFFFPFFFLLCCILVHISLYYNVLQNILPYIIIKNKNLKNLKKILKRKKERKPKRRCGARPKNNGLVQIQARPRSVLSEEKSQIKHYSVPIAPRKPVRGVTPPRTLRSPDEELSPTISVHPPSI